MLLGLVMRRAGSGARERTGLARPPAPGQARTTQPARAGPAAPAAPRYRFDEVSDANTMTELM